MTLSDAANWAQIISVPVTLLCWYFARESARKWLRRSRPFFLATAALLAACLFYSWGWSTSFFRWLGHPVAIPLWLLAAALAGAAALPLLWSAVANILRKVDFAGVHNTPAWRDYT